MPLLGEVVALCPVCVSAYGDQTFPLELLDIIVHHGAGKMRLLSDCMLAGFRCVVDGKEY